MIKLFPPTILKVRTVLTLLPQATNFHLPGCTLLMITYSWNARQRAHLAQLNFSGAENAKLAANISFKKRDYLPTIHKDLRDHLMKLMVYIITTKGYDIKAEDNDEVKYTSLTAKIDVRELNHILKTTLLGVETFNNDEVDEEFAEVTLNVWGVLGFERVLMAAAKRYVLSSNGDGHAYWDLIAPKGLTVQALRSVCSNQLCPLERMYCRAINAECKPFFDSKVVYRFTSPLAVASFLCGGNLDWPQFLPGKLDVLGKAVEVQVVVDPAQGDSPYPQYPFDIVLRSMYGLVSINGPRGLGLTFIEEGNVDGTPSPACEKAQSRLAWSENMLFRQSRPHPEALRLMAELRARKAV
ncbi:hypothetical protein KCU77_g205, partial [Aureobasidium melanogenum]